MSRAVVVAYAACALIWGTTWYAIRVCIAPGAFGTLEALALRFLIAIVILIPIALRARPWPRGAQWWWLVLAGVLDAVGYLLVYLGEERVPGAVAAVLYGTQPLILAVLLTATGMETITRRHVIGAVVSLAGVAILFLDRLDVSAQQAAGVGMIVASVLVATIYSMIMKRHTQSVHGAVSTTVFLVVTAAVLGIVALIFGDGPIPWPPPVWPTVALLYLAIIGSVVAFLAYFWLLGKTSLLVTSTLVFVYPLVAIVTDAIAGDETLTVRAYLGAGVTLSGLVVSLRRS